VIYFSLFILNLIILFFLARKKNLLSVFNIVYFSLVLMYMLPIIFSDNDWTFDDEFIFIIYIGVLGFLITLIAFRLKKDNTVSKVKVKFLLNERIVYILAMICLVFNFYQFLSLEIYSFNDLLSFLSRDRVGEYLSNPIIIKSIVVKPVMEAIQLILISFFWKSKRYKMGFLLWGLLLFDAVLISHGRFHILTILMLPFFYYNIFVSRVKIRHAAAILVMAVVLISVGNYARTGVLNSDNFIESISPETAVNQVIRASSGSTNTFYEFYRKNPETEFLKQYLYYLPISFIPRSIWEDKPIVSYFWRVTKEITGDYPNSKKNPVLVTTLIGEWYHQLSLVGVFLSIPIYILTLILAFRIIARFQYSELLIIMIIIHIPMDMRGGFNSFFISQVVNIYPLLILTLVGIFKIKKTNERDDILNKYF
jgi:oligosaccharide repeat unit polymerase